jgi:hypothetical protein
MQHMQSPQQQNTERNPTPTEAVAYEIPPSIQSKYVISLHKLSKQLNNSSFSFDAISMQLTYNPMQPPLAPKPTNSRYVISPPKDQSDEITALLVSALFQLRCFQLRRFQLRRFQLRRE